MKDCICYFPIDRYGLGNASFLFFQVRNVISLVFDLLYYKAFFFFFFFVIHELFILYM